MKQRFDPLKFLLDIATEVDDGRGSLSGDDVSQLSRKLHRDPKTVRRYADIAEGIGMLRSWKVDDTKIYAINPDYVPILRSIGIKRSEGCYYR